MSDSLVPSGTSNFSQQGSVDWVALSGSTLSFSVEVLSRFSRAGVEMITVAIGQALFSSFDVPADGQKRITDAVGKLKAFSSFGDALWFGFGIKHIVRTLCETEQGAACAGFCACLSVSYDSHFASQVLKCLADESMTSSTLKPSLSQWGALLNVCAGTVTDSHFPVLVEGFSRHLGYNPQGDVHRPLYAPTTAKALAGAIRELSKVSNGTLRSVTFEGGIDCSWLAAVSQWLLSLHIEIIDSSGHCIYSNASTSRVSHTQVTIIKNLSANIHPIESKIISRSYIVPPGSLCFGLRDIYSLKDIAPPHVYSGGRSEWESVLSDTFGSAAEKLFQSQDAVILAEFLCSGFQSHNRAPNTDYLKFWGDFNLDGYVKRRREFLSFASHRLPELRNVWCAAENNPKRTYEYFSLDGKFSPCLKSICTCSNCANGIPSPETTGFCLFRIGTIIFRFLCTLSWLDIEPCIKPSNVGLLMLYYTPVYGDEDPARLTTHFWERGLTVDLISLFTGSRYGEKTAKDISAFYKDGLCMYYTILKDPTERPELILRIRITPGQIERDNFLYHQVSDFIQEWTPAVNTTNLDHFIKKLDPGMQLQLIIHETLSSRSLEAQFYIHNEPFSELRSISNSQATLPNTDLLRNPAPAALRTCIRRKIEVGYCLNRNIKTAMIEYSGKTMGSWIGNCSLALSEPHKVNQSLYKALPKQGEWVVIEKTSNKVLRGTAALLISILFNTPNMQDGELTLSYIGPCFVCSVVPMWLQWFYTSTGVDGIYHISLRLSTGIAKSIIVKSDSDRNGDFEYEQVLPEFEWLEATPAAPNAAESEMISVPDRISLRQQKLTFYTSLPKKNLERFLKRRGLSFGKRITKRAMIAILQEDDDNHPTAAKADGFPELEQDNNDDIHMDDAE